ncbi:hemerythrin domain-containing protein [Sphaerotilus mobilis]|uniref:Hemerythrin-like domain-containing protein n=1 Tax=Sphaerotilus mobilis TaxID=47994 RepID=A0A4Q7LVD6_9BURK|nr:hemerythrin domain-containing protein [Sphaerotilus mobilis]RZS58262.1 hemerythrin-like domain-containing protein [Sphaerotilus mobilis]
MTRQTRLPLQTLNARLVETVPLTPLEVLDDEHRQMVQMLARLDRLVDADLDLPDAEIRALAHEVHTFFGEHARQHHALEELHVFPGLLNSADERLREQIERLVQDHGWLEQNWLELAPNVSAIAEGMVGGDMDLLRESVALFNALYHDHIRVEETLAYPEARRREAELAAAAAARRLGS